MVVAVDCARAQPHPGHDPPNPSRQWLAETAPRPAPAGRTWPQLAAPRPNLAAPWPQPAEPRQPRFGHEKMESPRPAPAGHTWPQPSAPRPSLAAPKPRPAAPRQPHLGHEKIRAVEPRSGRKKMELRRFKPTTLLFKDGWATIELRFVLWLMFLIYVIYTICCATSK
jgi:hypothetical protein